MRRLRFYTPLALRLAALLFVLMAVNTYIFLRIYRHNLHTSVAPKMAEAIAIEVRSIRTDWRLIPAAEKQQWLDEFNSHPEGSLKLLPADTPIDDLKPPNAFHAILQSSLQQLLGSDIRVGITALRSQKFDTLIDFNAGAQRLRVSIPGNAINFGSIWPFVWLLLGNALIISIGTAFTTWQINRPLKQSATALAHSANQLEEIQMPNWAPAEFQVFAERFNGLARRMQAQERERALLLAGVSHDLRAPLTRIRLHAEIIDEEASGAGSKILLDADSIGYIIDQFIDYQRGSRQALMGLIDPQLTVEDVVQRYRSLGREVAFHGDRTATILADPTALERILNNLIDNAFTYGQGPVEIRLSAASGNVFLEIRDHGPGIDPSEIGRVLKPFERLDEARSAQGHCGLGLAIVDRLVRELHGTLSISNHPAGGLLVKVSFPIREATIRDS